MPPRTNDFQELVTLIERALAPKGAKVTPSAMLPAHGLKGLREVDVLIDGQFGPYQMKVAVEAKDHGRKISIQTFDSLLAKYRGECRVTVDKFVIVSRRGFTDGVVEKARAADVELLTIEQAKDKKWGSVGPDRKMNFRAAPRLHRIAIRPKPMVVDLKFALTQGKLLCPRCRNGRNHGSPVEYAHRLFFKHWLPKNLEVFRDYEQQAKEHYNGNGLLSMTGKYDGWRLLLGGSYHPIETIELGIHIVNQDGPLSAKTYERKSSTGETKIFHHIEGIAGNHKMEVVLPFREIIAKPGQSMEDARREAGPHSFSVKFGRVNPEPGATPTSPNRKPKQSPKADKN